MQVEKTWEMRNPPRRGREGTREAERQGGRESQRGSHKVSHLYSLPSRQVSRDLQHQCPSHLTLFGGQAGNMRLLQPPSYLNALIMSLSG